MSNILKTGYEIMQYSICDGWINNLYDSNDNPYIFSTLEEAIAELQEEFDDWEAEIKNGDREEDDGDDICNFQIVCSATGILYELDLIDREVVVAHKYT
jgi:hypothetical protein